MEGNRGPLLDGARGYLLGAGGVALSHRLGFTRKQGLPGKEFSFCHCGPHIMLYSVHGDLAYAACDEGRRSCRSPKSHSDLPDPHSLAALTTDVRTAVNQLLTPVKASRLRTFTGTNAPRDGKHW